MIIVITLTIFNGRFFMFTKCRFEVSEGNESYITMFARCSYKAATIISLDDKKGRLSGAVVMSNKCQTFVCSSF